MDVSIIIVNYNTECLLVDCINSIQEKTYGINYEIIVVDNASSDNSVKTLNQSFPSVKLVQSKENLGFGKGNNLGGKNASGKYLFLLNTDTILINNAIKIFFDYMEENENNNVAACGGNLYDKKMNKNFSYSMSFPSLLNIFFYRFHLSIIKRNKETFNETGSAKDVSIIIGADLFIRKSVFDKVNGFDPQFFMYVEEGELQYRIRKLKYRIVSVPEAKIIHLQGTSSSSLKILRMEITSYSIYFKKHFNTITILLYKIIEVISALMRSIFNILILKPKISKQYLSIIVYIVKL